jgi:hypothetical protein
VYTQTNRETTVASQLTGLRIPLIIGVGQEQIGESAVELIRGSSASLDQQILKESVSARFVVSAVNPSNPTIGVADGSLTKFRVRNFPIVDGQGFGRAATSVRSVTVTVNGTPVSVGAVDGVNGYITLQIPPQEGDDIRATYYFRRTDTAFTDLVSDQVTAVQAVLAAPGIGPFEVVSSTSDTLILIINGLTYSLVFAAGSYSAAAMKTLIDSKLIPGLTTTVAADAAGISRLSFVASQQIVVGSGNANGIFGFTSGASTSRNVNFRVFQRPIVDGSDGGITTTDTSKVVVKVNGIQQIPTAVDGTNGIITLAMPPAAQSSVEITYFANTWQDTFDYLPNSLVTDIVRCGFASGRSDYIEDQDFVVENPSADVSVIHWGTSVGTVAGTSTAGATSFDDSQVLTTLVDNKLYLASATRYVDTNVVPAVASTNTFLLPEIPTTGNGRDTLLSQDVYNAVANGRNGLSSNRPDLLQVYAGRTVQDAISRSAIPVLTVDASSRKVVLDAVVPPDHNVYATFNYSRITDDQYVLTNKVSGAVGVGQFEVFSATKNSKEHQVRFVGKDSMSEIIQWPRGVEQVPDAFLTGAGTPVNETVYVAFSSKAASNAVFTGLGASPYNLYVGTSDTLGLNFNGTAFSVDLSTPAPAALVGGHISVDGSDSLVITTGTNDILVLDIDGTTVTTTLSAGTVTVASVVAAINAAIDATDASGTGGIDFTATAPNALVSSQRIGSAGGDHILTVRSQGTPSTVDDVYYVSILQGSAEETLGFSTFQRASATLSATNKAASVLGTLAGPFTITAGLDDSLEFQIDGVDYTIPLTAGSSVTAASIAALINATPGLAGVGSVGTGSNANKLRISSTSVDASSRVVIKSGSANSTLGFTYGTTANYSLVNAQEIVNVISDFAGVSAEGAVYTQYLDGQTYLTFESITTGATTSSVSFSASNALVTSTGLGIVAGSSGDNGEDASDIFTVNSSNSFGSAGTGVPGQTYTDERTGLRFTVLPSLTGSYTDGGYITLEVSETWKVNPSIPYLSVPGIEIIVTDTLGVGLDDTAVVSTFNPGGNEPSIGDIYYVDYYYAKQDYDAGLYRQFKQIESAFGPLSVENRVTMASYLAITNGASVVAIKQVKKQANSNEASDQSYYEALNDARLPMTGNIKPDIILPLTVSTPVYAATMKHVEVMSQAREQAERMAFIGFAAGTKPSTVQAIARGLGSSRVVAVYPDSAVVSLTDESGSKYEALVDSSLLAAALAGSAVSTTYDVATPYTHRTLLGLTRLVRKMDPVESNQTAMAGVTILEDLGSLIRVRQGLTTDMSSVLTRLPTVTQISDYVQQSSRSTLDAFIGTKFLSSRVTDVETNLNQLFKAMLQAEIVGAYTGIAAEVDSTDVTQLNVTGYYQPVFPLLYILLTLGLRSSI